MKYEKGKRSVFTTAISFTVFHPRNLTVSFGSFKALDQSTELFGVYARHKFIEK